MEENPDFDKDILSYDTFDLEKVAVSEALNYELEGEIDGSFMPRKAVRRTTNNKNERSQSDLYDWVQCLVAALLICVIVFAFFIRIIGIIGDSMNPTFEDSDSVVISNLFYEPKQGDIVVLRKASFQKEPIIKRIVATEGQVVEIDFDEGLVFVDGELLIESYILEPTYNQLDFDGPLTVPENFVFVMGDNRNNSLDSRFGIIGCVDERYIMGKVLFRLFPVSKFGAVN